MQHEFTQHKLKGPPRLRFVDLRQFPPMKVALLFAAERRLLHLASHMLTPAMLIKPPRIERPHSNSRPTVAAAPIKSARESVGRRFGRLPSVGLAGWSSAYRA